MENPIQFVQWLRSVAPYIHAFRGKTFVVAFPGELVMAGALPVLAHDLSLLHALGIKVVLVHGSRPQVEEQLVLRNLKARYHNGLRITDAAAMECAKEAAGELRLDIEAAFSQGLPNTPMAHAAIRIISGNFVTARPLGVIDGVDLEFTGIARKIAYETIHPILAAGGLVLLVCDPTARGLSNWVTRIAGTPPLVYLGEISYSIYLWHFPLIILAVRLGWITSHSPLAALLAVALIAAASIGLASLTFRWVERPAMQLGRARSRRRTSMVAPAAGCTTPAATRTG